MRERIAIANDVRWVVKLSDKAGQWQNFNLYDLAWNGDAFAKRSYRLGHNGRRFSRGRDYNMLSSIHPNVLIELALVILGHAEIEDARWSERPVRGRGFNLGEAVMFDEAEEKPDNLIPLRGRRK